MPYTCHKLSGQQKPCWYILGHFVTMSQHKWLKTSRRYTIHIVLRTGTELELKLFEEELKCHCCITADAWCIVDQLQKLAATAVAVRDWKDDRRVVASRRPQFVGLFDRCHKWHASACRRESSAPAVQIYTTPHRMCLQYCPATIQWRRIACGSHRYCYRPTPSMQLICCGGAHSHCE